MALDFAQLPTALLHALALAHPSGRFTYRAPHRTHIELRDLIESDAERLAIMARSRLEEHPAIHWVRRNAGLNRLVVAHIPEVDEQIDLVAVVEEIERELDLDGQPFARDRLGQPGSDARSGELALRLATNLSTLAISSIGLGRGGSRPELGVATTLVSALPTLRQALEQRFGSTAAEIGIDMIGGWSRFVNRASSAALSGLLVDSLRLAESRASEQQWRTWEPRLFSRAEDQSGARRPRAARRVRPLPRGPVETYVERATLMSTAAFLASMAMGRPLRSAAMFLYAGLPLPARVGQNAFISGLGHRVSGEGGLVLRREQLDRLDRVDRVVIDARVLPPAAELVDEVEVFVPQEALGADELRVFAARRLLGLADHLDSGLELTLTHGELDGNHYDVLRDGRRIGRVKTRCEAAPELELLRRAAVHAKIKLEAVGLERELQGVGRELGVCLEERSKAVARIRDHQRAGEVVMYLGAGPEDALVEADVSAWCWRADGAPVWAADLFVEAKPHTLALLIHAAGAARLVSARAVRIAQAEAVIGSSIGFTFPAHHGLVRVFTARHLAAIGAFVDGWMAARGLPEAPRVDPSRRSAWHAMSAEAVLDRLDSRSQGLDADEAQRRRETVAAPPLPAVAWFSAFVDELRNPMTPLLLGGAGLSAAVASSTEAALVGSVLAFDAAWAATQRRAAERRIDELSDWDQLRVTVVRGGRQCALNPGELVTGDVVELAAGDVVPADLRIIEASSLEADEAALTGEAAPVRKQREPTYSSVINEQRSLLFEGTSITTGHARAVVIEAGQRTQARRLSDESAQIAATRRAGRRESAARMETLGRLTLPAAGVAGAAVFASGLLRRTSPTRLLRSVVSLSVAAIPEGLTLLPTVAGLAASRRLADRRVRVRDHLAPERAAAIDVICLDKTGTITDATLRVAEIVGPDGGSHAPSEGEPADRVLSGWALDLICDAASASAPAKGRLDRVDAAIRALHDDGERRSPEPDAALAFDARRGYRAARVGSRLVVKGAPERIFERSVGGPSACASWVAATRKMSAEGLHVIAVAVREDADDKAHGVRELPLRDEDIGDLEVVGLLGLEAAPRVGVREALARFERLGVRAVMLTGDHPGTAAATARAVGLPFAGVVTGTQLDALEPGELVARIEEGALFARITPRQKARVIETLQRGGRKVAMVGDGANDAAALRIADVGVVVDTLATPAAIDASDVVIGGDLRSVADLIEEGRATRSAIDDAIGVLVGGNLGEIGFVGVAGTITGCSPLTTRQLLLVNALTDALPALSLAARHPAAGSRSVEPGEELSVEAQVAWRGLINTTAALAGWGVARCIMPRRRAETVGLLSVVGAQLGQTFIDARGDRRVQFTAIGSMAVLLAAVQTPGLSHLTGSRPVGPVGLGIAAASTVAATVAATQIAHLPEGVREAPARAMVELEGMVDRGLERAGKILDRTRRKGRVRARRLLRRAETFGDRFGFNLEATGAELIDLSKAG